MPTPPVPPAPEPAAIARHFLGAGALPGVQPWGAGLINGTWRVQVSAGPRAGDYLLQRVNPAVFPDPAAIMGNLARLARTGVRLPRCLADPHGALLVWDGEGGPWRLMEFIAPSRTLAAPATIAQATEIGRALGAFHAAAATVPVTELAITLPGFHDTPGYLATLDALRRQRPAIGNDARVAAALACIDARRALIPVLAEARDAGRLPVRVTHGDPKLDNVLFAPDADRALCLIDLDTVQPGLVHHDLADCLRSCCNRQGEAGVGAVRFDLDLARAILTGYAGAAPGLLSAEEVALLYPAIRLLPLELGLRFLTDHLRGDRYFRVTERGQNLTKAGIQFALVADIEAQEAALRDIIAGAFGA